MLLKFSVLQLPTNGIVGIDAPGVDDTATESHTILSVGDLDALEQQILV